MGILYNYMSSSSNSSSGVLSSLHSTPLKSILAIPIVSTVETDDCIIMDPPAKETNEEDFNSYTTNRQLILKNGC